MTTKVKSIKPLTLSEYKALVTNIPLYAPNAIFTVAGQTFTATQAVTYINNVLSAVAATATAKGAWKDAILAEQKLVAQEGATVKEIRNNIASMFSNASNTLAAFEIAPKKVRAPLTAAQRAAATAKAKATRIARGTTSKKQKALVTGDVTGVTITPVVAGSGSTGASGASAPVASGGTAPVASSGSSGATGTAAPAMTGSVAPAPAPAPAPTAAPTATPAAAPAAAPVPATGAVATHG